MNQNDSNPAGQSLGDTNPLGAAGTGQQQRGMSGLTGMGGSSGGGDMLDKAVNALEQKTGHQQGAGTTEKISDGIRSGFQKLTGKEVPVKDQQFGGPK